MSRMIRRQFLQQLTGIGAGLYVAGSRPLWALESSPAERLRIACIGVGGKGASDTDQAGLFGDIVGLCDIDDNRLNERASKHPKARKFFDFRTMLDQMQNEIDAVVVSTPDHTHAPAAMMAMRLGKHVYCQKPLTWSVVEARALRLAAHKYGVATQMGNQGTALDGFRTSIEVIRSGAIGPVREVHVWTDRCGRYWKQAPDITARPADKPDVPKTVHWDEFLGPAPERPYHPSYHPFAWRGWRDFGTGALGDMACHTANMAFMALGLGYPTSISSENSEVNPETFQQWATITFQFPARGEMPPVKLVWYEGIKDGKRNLPSPELMFGEQPSNSGLLLKGDKGVLFSPSDYGQSFTLFPKKDFEGFKNPEPTIPRLGGNNDESQKKEWIAACKGGPAAMSNFDYAGLLTEAMLLGNVAIRAGKPIEWDGEKLKIKNAPEAEQYLHR